jgi:hypothetical protein
VAQVVDSQLRGYPSQPEVRVRRSDGGVDVEVPPPAQPATVPSLPAERVRRPVRIFPYAVSPEHLDRAIRDLGVNATVCTHARQADVVLTLRALAKKRPKKLRELMVDNTQVHAIGSDTHAKIVDFLRELFELSGVNPEHEHALHEAENAIAEVIAHRQAVALGPQNPHLRRLQHQLVEAYGLASESTGRGHTRRVVVLPR